jgi:uncharacterized RDD family membrane protein YckC
MTQQDETGQSAAADQSVPPRPSPYLDASESAPQAYLAPPQSGQPRYASARSHGVRLLNGGVGHQPGDGQPGYAQPGDEQPGYGQARGRPLAGAQARRSAGIATPWARLAASTIDWLIIYGISVLAFWSPLMRVDHELQAIMDSSRGNNTPAMQAALNSLQADPSAGSVLFHWMLALFGIALAYFWVQHAAWGATVGKRVVGVRVVQADGQTRITMRAAGIRAAAVLVGPALVWLLSGAVGGVLWAADNGMALLDPRAQCLHDKLAGTIVVRKRWLDQQARSAGPW